MGLGDKVRQGAGGRVLAVTGEVLWVLIVLLITAWHTVNSIRGNHGTYLVRTAGAPVKLLAAECQERVSNSQEMA